ncbi:hypothetical protein F5I97DRAFT_227185 [Phlebopus sp. FC_14]|nr:hypothetical protein F5I97DRAFT_227185 [Phlebopus sp. FC_14]
MQLRASLSRRPLAGQTVISWPCAVMALFARTIDHLLREYVRRRSSCEHIPPLQPKVRVLSSYSTLNFLASRITGPNITRCAPCPRMCLIDKKICRLLWGSVLSRTRYWSRLCHHVHRMAGYLVDETLKQRQT